MSTYSNQLQPALQNLLQRVVRFFHPRWSCTTHTADVQRITLNALYMTLSGGRTKQLDIFCRVTDFTSDFLSCGTYSFTEPSMWHAGEAAGRLQLGSFAAQRFNNGVDLEGLSRVRSLPLWSAVEFDDVQPFACYILIISGDNT